jgi:hypothetical protein
MTLDEKLTISGKVHVLRETGDKEGAMACYEDGSKKDLDRLKGVKSNG